MSDQGWISFVKGKIFIGTDDALWCRATALDSKIRIGYVIKLETFVIHFSTYLDSGCGGIVDKSRNG